MNSIKYYRDNYACIDRQFIEQINQKRHLSFKTIDIQKYNKINSTNKLLGQDTYGLKDALVIINNNNLEVVSYKEFVILDTNILNRLRVVKYEADWEHKINACSNLKGVFEETLFMTINLQNVKSCEYTVYQYMFYNAKASKIDLGGLNTTGIINKSTFKMFGLAKADIIGLKDFGLHNIECMNQMFTNYENSKLELDSNTFKNCTDARYMFADTFINDLKVPILSKNILNITGMFRVEDVQNLTVVIDADISRSAQRITIASNNLKLHLYNWHKTHTRIEPDKVCEELYLVNCDSDILLEMEGCTITNLMTTVHNLEYNDKYKDMCKNVGLLVDDKTTNEEIEQAKKMFKEHGIEIKEIRRLEEY